jgi:hypothetical protein
MAGTTFQREFGANSSASNVMLADGTSIETALGAANRQTWLSTDILATGPETALDYRSPVSILDVRYGGARDCTQPQTFLTVTSGSPTGTLSSATAGLAAGHTVCIDTVGNLVVASVVGTTVTFTTNAPSSGSVKKFIYGTDNTTPFNNFFTACAEGKTGYIPSGTYLITGTIGILEPGDATGLQGLTVYCGGAGINTMRLADIGKSGGTTIVWGGAVGGTMMQFARISFVRLVGGLALVGQPSHDPSGVFTVFCNRAGLGFHLSQNATPTSGTGYMSTDDIVFGEMDLGIQFGTNLTDNNCDTSLINRMVFWRCTNGLIIKNTQGLSYRFNWIHAVSVSGYVAKSEGGGGVEIGSLHLSSCGTASGTAANDTYCIDLLSNASAYIFKIALLRIENTTVRVVALRGQQAHLQIGMFEEANNASTDKTLFYMLSGTLQILGGRILSVKSSGEPTFSLSNDSGAKAPRLAIRDTAMPSFDWSKLFTFASTCIADVSFENTRDLNQIVQENRHTRLERGRVVIGGNTTDATTATRLDPMMRLGGTSYLYSYSPRVPKGLCVIAVSLIGDHGANTPSVFKRRYTIYRDGSGTVTVVATETIGTDTVQGTDQLFSFGVDATQFTCNLQVKGTAATTVNWRATFVMESIYVVTPDY